MQPHNNHPPYFLKMSRFYYIMFSAALFKLPFNSYKLSRLNKFIFSFTNPIFFSLYKMNRR